MAAALQTRRIPLYFLFRRLGVVEYQSSNDGEGWSSFEHRITRLTISHVTTHGPSAQAPKLTYSNFDVAGDLGTLLFATYPANTLHAVCVVPNFGQIYITRHERDPVELHFVRDSSVKPREHNLVFDLDDTLIFDPVPIGLHVPGAQPVNAIPPHHIHGPADTPSIRPNVIPFLELVCPYFDEVRVCTMSIRQRASAVVMNLDPKQRTLLKSQRKAGKVVTCREDMQANGDASWLTSAMPVSKSLELCRLPSGKENRTVILDDCWDIWPSSAQENVVAVVPPQEMGNMGHDAYINGEDGGFLGKYMLVCLLNLALKEEKRQDLIVVQLPVGLQPNQFPTRAAFGSSYAAAARPCTLPPARYVPDSLALKRQVPVLTAARFRPSPAYSSVGNVTTSGSAQDDYGDYAQGMYSARKYSTPLRASMYPEPRKDYLLNSSSIRAPSGYMVRQF